MGVGGDRGDLRVGHGNLGIEGGELEVLLVLLRAVVAAREREDQRIVALELAEPARRSRVIGQLVVREHAAGCDVGAHQSTSGVRVRQRSRRMPLIAPVDSLACSLVLSARGVVVRRYWLCTRARDPRPGGGLGRSRARRGSRDEQAWCRSPNHSPVKSSERSSFMTSASTQVLSFKRKALAAVAALTMAGVV